MAMTGKTLRIGRFQDGSGKRRLECQPPVQDQSVTMEKTV